MDCVVSSWLYGIISAGLLDIVMTPITTARCVWLALEEQFVGNKETCALHLDAEFRNFVQGDLNISDSCHKLKGMADLLGVLGEPVQDRTLVLSVLRGLNDKFSHMAALLKRQMSFPSFVDIRNDLLLEEITMSTKPGSSSTALDGGAPLVSRNSTSTGAQGGAQGGVRAGVQPMSGGNRPNNRRRRNNSGGSGNNGFPSGVQGGWPPSFFNPWTGTVQVWPNTMPRTPLGDNAPWHPQQQQPCPHALTAVHTGVVDFPGVPYYGAMPAAPGYTAPDPNVAPHQQQAPALWNPMSGVGHWDQAALANAFNTMTLMPPPTTDWYMDSGATSHMTSDPGPMNQKRDRQVQYNWSPVPAAALPYQPACTCRRRVSNSLASSSWSS